MRRHQRHSIEQEHQSVILVATTTTTQTTAHDDDNLTDDDTAATTTNHNDVEIDVHHHHHHQQQQHQPLLAKTSSSSSTATTSTSSGARHKPTITTTSLSSSQSSSSPWNTQARVIGAVLVIGTACSSLINQHTSNIVPSYYFAMSVLIPFFGIILYPCLIYIIHVNCGWIPQGLGITSRDTFLAVLTAVMPVAACFALYNLLATFGTSGRISDGQPDIPIILSLILLKLVVPISLLLESIYEQRWPQYHHVIGVVLVMMGIIVAAMATTTHDDDDNNSSNNSTTTGTSSGGEGDGFVHNMKLLALVLCNIPLALGFLIVKRITTTSKSLIAHVSEFELWAVLCLPETFFCICLTFLVQRIKNPQMTLIDIAVELWHGIKCIAFATATTTDPTATTTTTTTSAAACVEAAKFTYLGLIPGFAYNLCIPVLVKALGDSTAIPLLRAVALPLAATIAMTGIDPVIVGTSSSSSFSWHTILGLLFAFTGLLIFTKTTTTRPSSSR